MSSSAQHPYADLGEGPAAELSTLLKFLNAAPMGMLQLTLDGDIELMNAVAARLLLPLVGGTQLANLFQLLQAQAPDLRERVAAFQDLHGTICDQLQLDISASARGPRDPQFLSLSISKLDSRRVMATLNDITQQVLTARALRDSEQRLQMAMTAAHLGVWEIDLASGRVLNSNLEDRVFGGQARLPLDSLENLLRQVHPEDLDRVSHTLQRAVGEGQEWRVEFRVRWADDSLHWVAVHGHIDRQHGRAVRLLCILIETTAQRTADAERLRSQMLEAENRQVLEASRMKSQFLANMSHELRTPLNAIIGFAELLQRGQVPLGSPKHAQFLGHIASSGHHLLQLINDVLDMAKVEAGKFEFLPQDLSLPDLVAEVVGSLQAAMQARQLHCTVHCAAGLDRVYLDPMRLKQVLFNYLSNAIKFTDSGGHIAVRVLEQGPDHLRIEVEDDGIGVAEADIGQLFREFHQLNVGLGKSHGGTGLGLALTRRLVQAQGGSVGVRSQPGVATVFHAVLNRRHGHDGLGAEGVAPVMDDSPLDRLLVIEADLEQQARLSLALAEAGYRVDAVDQGEQALRRAQARRYQGITLGLLLPDRSGLGTLERIRNGGASQATPVLGVSLPGGHPGAAASFAIRDLLSKPIRSAEVLDAIGSLQLPEGRRAARVLVLDDDPLARDLMRVTLATAGHQVQTCADAPAALALLQQTAPQAAVDALVLDLMMPGMNGFDMLAALRQLPQGRDLPVFIWTSMILSSDEYSLLSESARAIVAKGGGTVAAMVQDLQRLQQLAIL